MLVEPMSMRILFVLKGFGLIRHFEEVVQHFVTNGHTVILAQAKVKAGRETVPDSLRRLPGCSTIPASIGAPDGQRLALDLLRMTRDYLRYHEPALWAATANRRRALSRLVRTVSVGTTELPPATSDVLFRLDEPTVAMLRQGFRDLEAAFPADAGYVRFLESQQPDLLLVTPLVNLGGRQAEFVKAARALGVPSALPVFSWDNLSNKGVIHQLPDRVFVWNEVQRREAIDLHGVSGDAVTVTGAPRFDVFFRRSPSSERAVFCRAHGLDPGRALVVYLASSPTVTPNEPDFVDAWIAALRGSATPQLREAQLLVRAHPRAKAIWRHHRRYGTEATGAGVAIIVSTSAQSDQSLYDALAHADAAAGLNTSAELEAAILGTLSVYRPGADGRTGTDRIAALPVPAGRTRWLRRAGRYTPRARAAARRRVGRWIRPRASAAIRRTVRSTAGHRNARLTDPRRRDRRARAGGSEALSSN